MPAPRSRRRARLATLISVVLAITGFQFFLAPPAAQASVSTKIAAFPYDQDWSNAGLITANDDWTGVTGVEGYRGDDITAATGADPQTLLGEGPILVTDVNANQTNPVTFATGGPTEFASPFDTIALAGSGTADAPNLVFHLDLTGQTGTQFSFDARDIEASADDAVQQIAVQYRVGGSGNYTNLPTGYIADATTVTTATQVTHRDVALPAATDGSADVYVRVMTTNAGGNDEWVGVDNVAITQGPVVPAPVSLTNPGPQNSTEGVAIPTLQLAVTGGTPPLTYGATGLPPGLSIDTSNGQITGTPSTAAGSPFAVTVSVSDSAAVPTNDSENFSWTVTPAPVGVTPIKNIQGTGTSSPLTGQLVNTEGVVTAAYPTGGFDGFYMQTPGADTADASDAIFVYGGSGGFASYPAIGDSVDVTGTVGENFGKTQIASATWSPHGSSLGTVTAKTVVPGTDCALPGSACDNAAALDTAREAAEGEAFQPTGNWTLTDVYDGGPYYTAGSNSSSNFGELGVAAESTKALIAPTELYDTQTQAPQIANRKAWNDAHRIVVDDGSSTNYSTTTGSPFPWMTPTSVPRVGAAITFPAPTILIQDFSQWRLLPSSQVVGAPSATQPQLQQTRAANAAPQNVGGDVKLATFNVLNFFPTDGNEYVAAGGGNACTYFTDRQGNQITTQACGNPSTSSGNGPRGAANQINVARQRDKIVSAINTADADIVSLEELENSAKFGKPRDFAITELVNALNAASTPGKWGFAPSPTGGDLPALADEDVIRTGFIYQPAKVSLVGTSKILVGSAAFGNAREPLAQVFKKVGSPGSDGFAVVVNHFKSKGSGVDDGTGQGNANPDRIAQANALVTFANQFQANRGVTRTFLVGDFNAYSHEDPIDVLTAAGYTELHSTSDPDEESYNFDGQIGSLDHVLANAPAAADVSGVDVWPINGYESVYYEYSRFNYNVTNLYDSGPFRSSDHSPEIVGIEVAAPTTRDIQILATNDFHGRIANDPLSASAGAGVMAGAVNQLRAENPDTVFAAAGDLIGASTFESFIQNDKPTIDALNSAGLEVSSVGNHEFDQGYDDLVNRVMAAESASNPDGGAEWQYLGANVRFKGNDNPALPATWTKDFGDVTVGFVGVVTEHLPELVAPGGIQDIKVTDIVEETNAAADDLKDNQDADIVVMLVHEGAPMTDCAQIGALAPTTDFGSIVQGVNENVDAIVSGHTHLAYNCSFPVQEWVSESRPVTQRPVVSAGQYGTNLNRVVFTVDSTTHEVQAKSQALLSLKSCANSTACTNYPLDQPTQDIVDDALDEAAILGAVPLGQIAGPIRRGYLANGTTENRGVESSLGNLVADAQRWQTSGPEAGSAQIAFMNPGGLRADMLGNGASFPKTVTFKQAAEVQPFANGLVNMDLTGAQIKAALEQQWQPPGSSRPFLKLGASKGFTYTSDPDAAQGSRITGMWLDGVAIVPATVYSVTVNSFLSTGGDNFTSFAGGVNKAEAGLTDLQAMVNYLDEFANTGEGDPPLPVPTRQNGVHVNFPVAAPATYNAGDHVTFDVSGWSYSNADDPKDTDVVVKLGAATLGTFPLNNTIQAALPGFDATGTASVDVVVPPGLPDGTTELHLTGATTGTDVIVPITADDGLPNPTVSAPDSSVQKGQSAQVVVTVTPADADGTVSVLDGAVVLGTATLASGSATVTIPANLVPTIGVHELDLAYSGETGQYSPSVGTFTLTVTKATPTVNAVDTSVQYGKAATVTVNVTGPGGPATGTVTVRNGGTTIGSGTVSGGVATVTLPARSLPAGTATLTADYSGDANLAAGSDSFTVSVSKATSTTEATVKPKNPNKNNKVKLTVKVQGSDGVEATGEVKIKVGGKTITKTLTNGKLKLNLGKFGKGKHKVKVTYLGSTNVEGSKDTVKFTVS